MDLTTATQLVWLTGLRAQPSRFPRQPCYQKDTNKEIWPHTYDEHSYINRKFEN